MTEPRHDRADDTAAKDTRTGASTLPSDVLDLLAAIRDAVHVPLPSTSDADDRAWHRLMQHRLTDLSITLEVALDPEWIDTLDATREAANIRQHTADTPVTYTMYERPAGGDQ